MKKLSKWAVVASTTFLLDLTVFVILIGILGSAILANTISFLLSSTFNFALHRLWTFDSKAAVVQSLYRYIVWIISSSVLSSFFVIEFIAIGFDPGISKVVSAVLLLPINYHVGKLCIFSKKEE
jgi:putative flippase GtrA